MFMKMAMFGTIGYKFQDLQEEESCQDKKTCLKRP
jgi:hypothetical protein